MKKIEKVYVPCCNNDVHFFTKVCVASIRYWYPDIPICLIKDYLWGEFDTSEIERCWNVSVLQTKGKSFGWGFSKFEALFLRNRERVLIVDSDTVFLGKVIDALEVFDEDFIVTGNVINKSRLSRKDKVDIHMRGLNLDKLKVFDPEYTFPGYILNGGQIVATCGKIHRSDFSRLIDWRMNQKQPTIKHRDIFCTGDQGVLNYLLTTKQRRGQISIKYFPFVHYPDFVPHKRFFLPVIKKHHGYPLIMHWAGTKVPFWRTKYPRILMFYYAFYRSKVKT